MSASEHAIVEAFGVPLAVDPGDLSAKGFTKKGKDISLWIGVQEGPRYGGDRRLKGTPISMV